MKTSDRPRHSALLEIPEEWDGKQERFEVTLQTPSLRIERILSRGHTTPAGEWYDQDHDEWVMVLAGAARLAFENGEELALGTGDAILLPAHTRHRVVLTTAEPVCIWLTIHGAFAGSSTL